MDNKNILVVDDILLNRLLLTSIIRKMGYAFQMANNGKQAIDLILAEKVDLVFMDIEMPVMNGLETSAYIRNKLEAPFNSIPIIAITTYSSVDIRGFVECKYFNDLIIKPYTIEKIDFVIKKYTYKTE